MSDDLKLRFERTSSAPPDVVWRLLTERTELPKWWGPHGFATVVDEWDLRVGGRYRLTMQPPGGEAFHLGGEFREVVPEQRLVYTFVWEEPDPDDIPAVVTITLEQLDAATRLTVEHGPFAHEARMAPPTGGWTEGLDKLEALLMS